MGRSRPAMAGWKLPGNSSLTVSLPPSSSSSVSPSSPGRRVALSPCRPRRPSHRRAVRPRPCPGRVPEPRTDQLTCRGDHILTRVLAREPAMRAGHLGRRRPVGDTEQRGGRVGGCQAGLSCRIAPSVAIVAGHSAARDPRRRVRPGRHRRRPPDRLGLPPLRRPVRVRRRHLRPEPVPQLARLPEVASAFRVIPLMNGQPTCSCHHAINPTELSVSVVSQGRVAAVSREARLRPFPRPSSTDQVLASFTLQRDFGVQIGTVIRVPFYASSQPRRSSTPPARPAAAGSHRRLPRGGIEASDGEFPSGTTPSYGLYPSSAFARTVTPRIGQSTSISCACVTGAADFPRLNKDINALRPAGAAGFRTNAK